VLPHVAAGAMSAIEDAEAISFYLRGANRDTVHDALLQAFRARYKRASWAQAKSRADGLLVAAPRNSAEDLMELWTYPGAEQWVMQRPDMIMDV
jgi:2-polyprenyl-6-methoxyphenol hydroxylase-like FAD-dependent oxidoreductase